MKRNVVAWAALVVSVGALVSSHGLTRPMPAAPQVPEEGQRTARALSEAFEAVADFVKPSVVQINVQRKAGATVRRPGRDGAPSPFPFPMPGPGGNMNPGDLEEMLRRFFGPDGFGPGGIPRPEREQFGGGPGLEGTGSGFVYDDRGHILTNNHVVEGANKIVVTFHDGVELPATVVGTDPKADVAVIKVDSTSYRPVLKGQSKNVRVGEWVLALGSPFGLDQTVTAGIISATNRNDVGINDYESFIQTDASINPGNSGGPLVDMSGRVVGVNSAIVTPSRSFAGVGFAIPIDMAANLADKLIKDGKVSRARIGIQLQPLTPALAKQFGLDPGTRGILVGDVVEGSPAAKAGLKQGDVITGFNGQEIANMAGFRNMVAASDIGKSYELTYLRNGKSQTTKIVPAAEDEVVFAFENRRPDAPAREEAPKAEFDDFGLGVQELTPELAAQFGYPEDAEGLVVSSVKEGSPAEAAGLEPGDLILKVIKDKKLQAVEGLQEFRELAKGSDELALYIRSSKNPGHFVTLSKAK